MEDPKPTTDTLSIQPAYVAEHNHADRAADAHPIDDDIVEEVCETKAGPVLLHDDLALIQAVAIREVLPYNNDNETWIDHQENRHYFTSTSSTFYFMLAQGCMRYDHKYVEIDDAPDIAEAHTRQYLRDMHGYEGDFEPTLCHAQNDEHRLREEEPEDANYAFADARGLVIETGTHDQ